MHAHTTKLQSHPSSTDLTEGKAGIIEGVTTEEENTERPAKRMDTVRAT